MTAEQRRAKQKVVALACKLGATLDYAGGEINVEAPPYHTWKENPGVHELVNSPWDDETQDDLWARALERMEFGVEPCTIQECEWCADTRAEGVS